METNVTDELRIKVISDAEGESASFIWNRYRHLSLVIGDTIIADVSIKLSPAESYFLMRIGEMDIETEGAPDDILAGILAKVFDAGMKTGA